MSAGRLSSVECRLSIGRVRVVPHRGACAAVLLAALLVHGPGVQADLFADYTLTGSFSLPTADGLFNVFDVTPDGRVVTLVGAEVYVETAVGSRAFALLGSLPEPKNASPFPAFVRVSPGGGSIAVGNNFGQVGVFDAGNLSGAWYDAAHFDAEWIDDRLIALSGGCGAGECVDVLDTSSDPGAPQVTTVVSGIGGASAGIAFDAAGNLYTANGFSTGGPSGTGAIKAFTHDDWLAALQGGGPLDFEASGTLVADILSGASLGFDAEGNLHVGGGDFFGGGESGFAALVSAAAVADAWAGQGPADNTDPLDVRTFDPEDANPFNFYDVNYNPVTAELYLREGANVYVYAVPEPGALVLLGVAGAAVALRRRGGSLCHQSDGRPGVGPLPDGRGTDGVIGNRPLAIGNPAAIDTRQSTIGNRYSIGHWQWAIRHSLPTILLLLPYAAPGLFPALAMAADPYADEVVDASSSLDGSGLYNDPLAVLGPPTTTYYDFTTGSQMTPSVAAGPFYLAGPAGEKIITTLATGQFIKLRFDEPIEDDPRNPYGIDLIVFGNSFFVSAGFVGPDTDMGTLLLPGGMFTESVTVAVSASGVGSPTSDPDEWYVYSAGPFADGLFPTNAYAWDSGAADWGAASDFTRPADPGLSFEDFEGLFAAEAIELYEGSGGGTGYDLAESGFESISYVYLTGAFGEVDALADVRAALGDLDDDGDIDMADVAGFQRCFSGGEERTAACFAADFDGDHDVDGDDHALTVQYLGGPA